MDYATYSEQLWSRRNQVTAIPGIPQSSSICNAAHAVPPVAMSGSRRNTVSTGTIDGSLE